MRVSVVVVTYNHERYIDSALRSVFDQRTDFPFEVIISEDASDDRTRDIVCSWRDRHPDRTRLILSTRNLRSNEVVARAFGAAQGEYVALLDGDDYWISSDKLQRQVECLDADPSLSMCFHNARVIGGEAPFEGVWTSPKLKPRLSLADLWQGNPFATCTSMFRRAAVGRIPPWYYDFFPVTDWPLYILFAERGDLAFIPDAMGMYRLHSGGLYSSQSLAVKLASMDRLYRRINECLGYRYDSEVRIGYYRYFVDWAKAYFRRGDFALARTSFDYARGYGHPVGIIGRFETAELGARLMLDTLYSRITGRD